jgi:hypothetical protein
MNVIEQLQQLPSRMVVAALLLTWLAYGVVLAIYRLYFSPLAKFPGPKLAALSRWYEFYYEVFKQGYYTFRIREMHQKYGKKEYPL